MTLPEVAIGVVIAAMVTGAISLIALILGKEQKTSEFRQAWIDALRQDCAEAVAQFLTHTNYRALGGAARSEAAVTAAYAFRKASATVKLRANLTEDSFKLLLIELSAMEALMDGGDLDFAKCSAATDRFASATQPILKTEWDRVRIGETWFRVAKVALIIIIVLTTTFLLLNRQR